jgi:GTP cyclohydrolase I
MGRYSKGASMNVIHPEFRPADDGDDTFGPDGKLIVPPHVQSAIRTLIEWADDPTREGLVDTPARVGRAWRDY